MSFEDHMATRNHENKDYSIEEVKSILEKMNEDVDPEIRAAIEATRKAARAEAINEAREDVLNSFNRPSGQASTSEQQLTPGHSLESLGNSNNLDTPRDLEGGNMHSNTSPSSAEPDSTSDPNSPSSNTNSEPDQENNHMATRNHENKDYSIEEVKSILEKMDEDVDPEIRAAIEATRKAARAEAINEAREDANPKHDAKKTFEELMNEIIS